MTDAGGRWHLDVRPRAQRQLSHLPEKIATAAAEFNLTDGVREFYICPGDSLRRDVRERHEQFLRSKDGTRPRSPGNKHAAIYPAHVRRWLDDWAQFA